MAFNYSPKIVRDSSLVLCLDAANPNSFVSGSTIWRDVSKGGNNGTLNGPIYNNSVNGGIIVFDGTDDYVDTKQIQFERTNPFSLCIWVYPTLVSNHQLINNENSSYTGYRLDITTTSVIGFSLRNTPTTNQANITTTGTLLANKWYNIVATYNGSSNTSGMNIYINGAVQSVTSITNNLTSTIISNETTWIGLRRPATTGPFSGRVSNVQIYNRALSATEVLQNYKDSFYPNYQQHLQIPQQL